MHPEVRNYASSLVGAAEYALAARAWWRERAGDYAAGRRDAYTAMLDLLLGTRDETEARAKLERIG